MLKRQVTYDASASRKRAKYSRSGYAKKGMVRYKTPSTFNRCIIATGVDGDFAVSPDSGIGYGFAPLRLWINGATSATVYATDISFVWDLCRIVKVEVTILPGANSNDFDTGTQNIPVAYHAFDPNSGAAPTLASIKQNSTCKIDRLDKVIRRTIYPNLFNANAIVNSGWMRKDQFVSSSSDTPSYGFQLFVDNLGTANPNTIIRVYFKVFLEVKSSI